MNPRRENNARNSKAAAPVVRANLRVVRSVSYADLSDSTIADMVRLVAKFGAAVMFATTADGGAFSICVLDNQNKIKEYPHDADGFEAVHRWLRDEYFGDGGNPSA